MKTLLLIIATVLLTVNASAQTNTTQPNAPTPGFYLGMGTGIENFSGIFGVTGDFRVSNTIFLKAGAGIGSWGGKLSAGLRYETKVGKSLGYGIYLCRATGLKEFTYALETTSGTHDVKMELMPGFTLNPTISYKWLIHNLHRFFIEAGYAIPLQTDPWKVKDGSELTESSKNMLHILAPGGFSLGLGIQFAL
jgi:hypothetical protein